MNEIVSSRLSVDLMRGKLLSLVNDDRLLRWACILASGYWAYFWLLHKLLGPLNIDELYFTHTMWLVRQGMRPFIDFYSLHLPYYFNLYDLVLPGSRPDDLSFIVAMRLSSVVVIGLYIAMLVTLAKKQWLLLLPLLLSFIVLGRASEIRADTFGLLLFNAGWWILIVGRLREKAALAALVSGLALFFSARAAVMAPGIAIACLVPIIRQRSFGSLKWVVAAGGAIIALILAIYLFNPASFELMIRSVFVDSSRLTNHVSLLTRISEPVRAYLMILIVTALVTSALAYRRNRADDAAFTVMIACAFQLALVLVDPSPYEYVYSWALIPVMAGLAIGFDRYGARMRIPYVAVVSGASLLLLGLSLVYLVVKGHSPPTSSNLRLTFDRTIAVEGIRAKSLPDLVSQSISRRQQQNLWNQLAIRSEICRRVKGKVLAGITGSPICLHDASHDWTGLTWPDLHSDGKFPSNRAEFERLMANDPPGLVIWGSQYHSPGLTPWGQQLLSGYVIGDGYALRRDSVAPAPSLRRPTD